MFRWRQHRVIDASAVSVRFAAASLSRDTLRSGPFTVGRAFRKEPITNMIQLFNSIDSIKTRRVFRGDKRAN
jgi:hypothetical protein